MRGRVALLLFVVGCSPGTVKLDQDSVDSGDGAAPDIALDTLTLDLGAAVSDEQLDGSVTISNLGDADLNGAVALSSGDVWYAIDGDAVTLAPGESVVLGVSFAATNVGSYEGEISITSDDPDEPVVTVALTALVDIDTDGDGGADAEDCAPEDPSIYPGAEETWYDGVDQDCSGTSDYDQDQDGYDSADYGGDDCDDADGAVSPGAEESWYDGLDQDCDQRSDYDQDQDGYDSADYGGDDCDDTSADIGPGAVEDPSNGVDDDCDGRLDEDPATSDDDRDGVTAGDGDCNDGDATVYPGAEETWYDGVDSDCSGGSDYDQDGDGYDDAAYGGDDCNDLDDGLNPGAAETWYDGVDQDCSGGSDYDQDSDTFDSNDYGGDDCDDTDEAVYPGAGETWYDGVDSDCSGGSDYDQDGDGETTSAYGGRDCDDTDASVYSTASETCDGVDNDCDGAVDEGVTTTYYADADTDGYGDASVTTSDCSAPDGYVANGTDCDDTDPTRNPGAAEVSWSGVDEDCDSLIDDMSAEAESAWTVLGESSNDAIGSSAVLAVDDLDSDDRAELIIGAPSINLSYDTDAGAVAFHDTSRSGSRVDFTDGWLELYGDSDDDYGGCALASLGDIDGDGYGEVAIGSYGDRAGERSGAGTIYLVDLSTSSTYSYLSYEEQAEIYGNSSSGYLGYSLAAGDMDGDGDTDVATGAPGEQTSRGRVYVALHSRDYYGAGGDTTFSSSSASYNITGVSDNDHLGYSVAFGDLNGDGYDDLVACSPDDDDAGSASGTCWVDRGSSSVSSAGTTVSSVDDAVITGSAANDRAGLNPGSLAVGDLDDDGVDDLAVGVPGYDGGATDGGAVFVYAGGDLSGSETASTATWLLRGEGALGASVLMSGDVNADGVTDLVAGATSASSTGMVYVFGGGQPEGTYDLPDDQTASWSGKTSGDAFGASLGGLADLDGDGVLDLVAAASANDDGASGGGKVYVLSTAP